LAFVDHGDIAWARNGVTEQQRGQIHARLSSMNGAVL
jgi:hypothetical protein